MPELWINDKIDDNGGKPVQVYEVENAAPIIPFLAVGASGFISGVLITLALMSFCGR